jgi:hypothetical protein
MRGMTLRAAALCTVAALSACGGGTNEPAAANEQPASVIGDPLHRALDRAESVQDTLDERAADLRERLEEAEGN